MPNHKQELQDLKEQIRQLEKQNQQLRNENTKLHENLAAALDRTGLFIWEQDVPTGQLKIINQTFGTMCGYQPNEMESTVESWKKNLHPEDRERVIEAFHDHLAGKSPYYHVIHRMVHKDGHDVWVSDRGRVIEYDQQGKPLRMMGTHIDITQEKLYELELAQYANLDPLTNLLNKKALQNYFEAYTHTKEYDGGALLFIDLDDFKAINDIHGHNAGDKLLEEIADRLNEIASKHEIIARVGGDEFAILSKSANKNSAEQLAKSILTALAKPVKLKDVEIQLSVSIGVCLFRRSDESFALVYEKADKAMYSIKRKTKNNFCFWQKH